MKQWSTTPVLCRAALMIIAGLPCTSRCAWTYALPVAASFSTMSHVMESALHDQKIHTRTAYSCTRGTDILMTAYLNSCRHFSMLVNFWAASWTSSFLSRRNHFWVSSSGWPYAQCAILSCNCLKDCRQNGGSSYNIANTEPCGTLARSLLPAALLSLSREVSSDPLVLPWRLLAEIWSESHDGFRGACQSSSKKHV